MEIKIKLNDGVKLPISANPNDTGYDLVAISEPKIVGEEYAPGYWKRIDYLEYDTGIQISPAEKYSSEREVIQGYAQIFPRSSVSKYNLVLCNHVAIIDHDYRGNILLRYRYVFQPEDMRYEIDGHGVISYGVVNDKKIYHKGDKIAQLVAAWKESINWIQVNELGQTERGKGGFGSSDSTTIY